MYQLRLGSVLCWVYCCRVEYLQEIFVAVHMICRGFLENCNKLNVGIEVYMCMKTFDVSCGTVPLVRPSTSHGQYPHIVNRVQ